MTSSGWMPVSPCGQGCIEAPGTTPQVWPTTRVWRVLMALCVLLGAIPVLSVQRLVSPERGRRLMSSWCRMLLRALGMRVEVHDSATGADTALLVANHVSWLDPVVLMAAVPMRVVSKTGIGEIPIIGGLARGAGTIFIDRPRLSQLPGVVDQVSAALREGTTVAAFPQGTTFCEPAKGRFRPALFQAAVDAGVPVRPVLLDYRLSDGRPTAAASFLGDESMGTAMRRTLGTRGLVVHLRLMPAVQHEGADRRALSLAAEEAVSKVPA
ncbi:1-acyl-sn-glycerol-3-phosphate acyltransferase [Allokutzneria sp. A3M-2-11 16]|uniref:lysophospholipid acyltransferase family protein n=1 Tax=Allokutzneria sp. A3M-2-11 16 TaxID=2962043 RepID=UPI0020B63D9B|nr:lysophospholipid acyltransferase family protein [Allokutzneria sp. A3M-2-11 16]MCP3802121.1 1-acyl-sn-glycerol-3-phosphate acyltransferase [Allokutzneria sp. A3M-2-11 16]